jgi:hypothetical protein
MQLRKKTQGGESMVRFFIFIAWTFYFTSLASAYDITFVRNNYGGKINIYRNDGTVQTPTTNSGTVVLQNPDAAEVIGSNQISLKTKFVVLSPGAYQGTFWVSGVEEEGLAKSGTRGFVLIKSLKDYSINFAPSNGFSFALDKAGIIVPDNPVTSQINDSGDVLTFATQIIRVEPSGYAGQLSIVGVTQFETANFDRQIRIVPGVKGYIFAFSLIDSNFRFDMSDGSTVSIPANVKAAASENRVIKLQNARIEIRPENVNLRWYMQNDPQKTYLSTRELWLPIGMKNYGIGLAAGKKLGKFDLDENGNLSVEAVKAEDETGAMHNFYLNRKVIDQYQCKFTAEITLGEDIGTLKKGRSLELEADFKVSDRINYGAQQSHFVWNGLVTISIPNTSHIITSDVGQIVVLNDLPVGSDSFNISIDNVQGTLGGLPPTSNGMPISFYINGDYLNSANFVPKFSDWWFMGDKTRKQINFQFANSGQTGRITDLQPRNGSCSAVVN